MRFRLSILAITIALIAWGSTEGGPPERHREDGYVVYASSEAIAVETEEVIKAAIEDAISLLGDTVSETIAVTIVDTRDEFRRQTRGAVPDWGVGCAIPSRNEIVVLSPLASEYEQSFGEIVRHEWAHIALRHKVGRGYLPRFIDEGFAMNFADQWGSGYAVTLAKAQLTGSLFPLQNIDRVNFFNSSQAQIAYAQSHAAVAYFYSSYGEKTFLLLMEELRRGASLEHAMENTIGASFIIFEEEYRKYIKDNYNWYLIFFDMTFLWIGLALLIVFGFLLKKKKGRDTIKRWEEEEKYQSTDFDYEEGDPWD